jgi:hypothetical protein
VTFAEVRTDLAVLACAIAAGVQAALAGRHPALAAAAVAFGVLVLVLPRRKEPTMHRIRPSRPIPIALTALVAFFSALTALAVTGGMAGAHGHAGASHPGSHHGHHHATLTPEAVAFRADMRKLWEDHITWTRVAIISLTTDSPDTQASVGRLLRNQDDIGAALASFYGRKAGDALAGELRKHILIAADVIAAARAGDADALADAQARWTANADDIASLLHRLNPRFWPLTVLEDEMHRHLALTTDEAVARLQADWDADVAAYDRVHEHILHMSDLLAEGVIRQFPRRFR